VIIIPRVTAAPAPIAMPIPNARHPMAAVTANARTCGHNRRDLAERDR
jgi:hypothetical protein